MTDSAPIDELAVEVGADGVSLSSKGGAASRLGHAIADAISPFTNALGWTGDYINIKRQQAVLRAAEKAKEKLLEDGIEQADIPPRILLPWLEGASMETEESTKLTDMWAGLFARAAKSSDAVIVSYIETLKRLGKDEASLLEFFATDTSTFFARKFYDDRVDRMFAASNPLLGNLVERLERVLNTNDVERIREFMDGVGFQGMRQVIFFSALDLVMVSTPYFDKNEHTIANLEHLGLIRIQSDQIKTKYGIVTVMWFSITKYAFDMIWACHGTLTGNRNIIRGKIVEPTAHARKDE